jgi:hypothetical protein
MPKHRLVWNLLSENEDKNGKPKMTKDDVSGGKTPRPWFKKRRFWLIGLVALGSIGTLFSSEEDNQNTQSSDISVTENTNGESEAQVPVDSASTEVEDVKETVSQSNARRSAESYLSVSAFSRTGLIKQLEFEGFSLIDATYAVDAVDVDWNEQAAKSAASYLEVSSFSRSGLIKQLEFEGFTREQAEYGVSTTGL